MRKRAVFMWDEATCKEALPEVIDGKVPDKVNGVMLVLEKVAWKNSEDAMVWAEALPKVSWNWIIDRVDADTPFVPPEEAKEHCVYLWDEKAADAWLEKLEVNAVGKPGKAFMSDEVRNETFDFDTGDKIYEALKKEALLFMKDLAKASTAEGTAELAPIKKIGNSDEATEMRLGLVQQSL